MGCQVRHNKRVHGTAATNFTSQRLFGYAWIVAHFDALSSHFIYRPGRISCRTHLEGTEKNEIRLSQTLRMGLGAVTILFYVLAAVEVAKAKRAFACILSIITTKNRCAGKSEKEELRILLCRPFQP
jgi:hypothetical protein